MTAVSDRIQWLLHEGDNTLRVPVAENISIRNEHWNATIVRLDVGAGLRVFLTEAEVRHSVTLEPSHEETDPWLVSDISVRGRIHLELSDGPSIEITPERSVIFRPTDQRARFTPRPARSLRLAGFMIRADRLRSMFGDEMPPVIRLTIEGDGSGSPLFPIRASGRLRQLAGSLFSLRLHGALKLIFMEGVILQLLAEQSAVEVEDRGRRRNGDLSPSERAALAEAHDRLLADIRSPPSLDKLASTVGMSEKSLNAGFRKLYGATPYEILRNERLEHARVLLKTEDVSTKTIAFRVGYDHVSNFTRAFASRFGAPPRRFLRSRPE